MIVVDASAVVDGLLRTAGDRLDTRLSDPDAGLDAPHLIDVDVAPAVRRLERCRLLRLA